jgi:quercetin dioxygenase-like cupin family protein
MNKIELSSLPSLEKIKGFHGKFIHTPNSTISFWDVEAGSILPSHSHVHAQTTQVLEGEFELTVDGLTELCKPGFIVIIPSHAVHSGIAITSCKIMDTFCPAREDYK